MSAAFIRKLPLLLMLDGTMPAESSAALSEIATLIYPQQVTEPALLEEVQIAVCSPITGFDSIWFDRLPALKLIAVFGVGLDRVDMTRAQACSIAVTVTRDILTHDTADMAFALLLALTRQIVAGDSLIRSGKWGQGVRLAHGHTLRGKKIGIVGLGAIGRDIARKAEIFGMEVAYYNRQHKPGVAWAFYDNLQELAYASDILAVAIAATVETNKIISADILEALGTNGLIVNIARGAVIDESALIDALRQRRIAGAGLDVFCNEPDIDQAFFQLSNVVLAPHQGSATIETRLAMGQCVVDNVRAFLTRGYPLTAV